MKLGQEERRDEVFKLKVLGWHNRDVAKHLGVKEKTVVNDISNNNGCSSHIPKWRRGAIKADKQMAVAMEGMRF